MRNSITYCIGRIWCILQDSMPIEIWKNAVNILLNTPNNVRLVARQIQHVSQPSEMK
jgi:hypothetical protein